MVQGTWNIGGFNLPDFGLTEKVASPGDKTFYNPAVPQSKGLSSAAFTSGFNGGSSGGGGGGQTSNVQGAFIGPVPNAQNSGGGNGGGGGQSWADANNQWVADGRTFTNKDDYLNYVNGGSVRNEIESGFNSYFSELDKMIGNIPGQKAGQEQIVQNNYNQGVSDINSQKESSLGDLNTSRRKNSEQQVKSFQDIADNIKNLFQAGNVMLGTKGAGDSSAANQYSYAVTKLGSKQRGDVMSQTRAIENDIADREAKLNNIVTQETGRLKTERDNAVIQIAQYFQDAQNQLLQAKANGQLQKGQSLAQLSTQLLQNAQAMLMQQDQNFKNQQNALMSWATSNSKTIGELKTNLASLGQYNVPGVQARSINGTPQIDAQGNMTTPFYGGAGSTEKKPENINQLGSSLYSGS